MPKNIRDLDPELKKYIASEQFIHDHLVDRGEQYVKKLYGVWREQRCIHPLLLSWPAERVQADNGKIITHLVLMDLSSIPQGSWSRVIKEFIVRTKAYAICLTEQQHDVVSVQLESVKGTRVWRLPIERHGDVLVLGKASSEDNVPALGYLWRPGSATS